MENLHGKGDCYCSLRCPAFCRRLLSCQRRNKSGLENQRRLMKRSKRMHVTTTLLAYLTNRRGRRRYSAMIITPFPHRLLTPPRHSTSCRRAGTPAMRPKILRTLYSGLPLAWTCARHSGRRHMHSGSVINRIVIVHHPPERHRTHPPYPVTHVV